MLSLICGDYFFPKVAEELRESIHKETGLTCSAGVAPNRLLAKVLSDNTKDMYLLVCLYFSSITQIIFM